MKKINYYIVGRFGRATELNVKTKQLVTGDMIDEYAAVRKNENFTHCKWVIDSIQTGLGIVTTGSATRKAAIAEYEKVKETVIKMLTDKKQLEGMMKYINSAIDVEELAKYEELEYSTTYSHRLDKVTEAAKRHGCIIKPVEGESYQSGGHVKIYGLPGMLGEARTIIENQKARDAEQAAREAREAEPEEQPEPDMIYKGMQFVNADGEILTITKIDDMQVEVNNGEKAVIDFGTSRHVKDIEQAFDCKLMKAAAAAAEVETEAEAEPEEAKQPATDPEPEKQEVEPATLNLENLKDYLPCLLMSLARSKDNNSLIMSAGIEAGKISPQEILDYFQRGAMPAIHTFDAWKQQGRNVKKGEHAAFTAYIWKHTEKTVKIDDEEKVVTDFIRVKSFFFTAEQTEKAAPVKELVSLPDDCKKEVKGSYTWISGNTRPIKEDLKAAGFWWSKKNSAWYRAA
jgi:hypothetical protein